MKNKFSLRNQFHTHTQIIEKIYNCIKITLGPTGKNGILATSNQNLKFLTNGSLLLKGLQFQTSSANIFVQLFELASFKTVQVSGDGSTLTILFCCELCQNSFRFLSGGYNSIFLRNGFKKVSFFLNEKVLNFSLPVSTISELVGIFKTVLGKKVKKEINAILGQSITQISRDGLILVEDNNSRETEIETIQGIEIDKGFASSYFITDFQQFEVNYENPYLLIANTPIQSLNQLTEIIDYVKLNNRPLIIVAEEISKEIISTLVLNNIKKKFKVAVIKYSSIQFIKNGLLEDLAFLTHSNYFSSTLKATKNIFFTVEDLGQADRVIIKKEKSTFFISKFAKVLATRRMNELNRELVTSDSEYEKSIFKNRIARFSGQTTKIKLGISNQYESEELKQKIGNLFTTLKASLEEGFVAGGGSFYFYLEEEIRNWSCLNLIGEEIFSGQIVANSLLKPFENLFKNGNLSPYFFLTQAKRRGYPFGYNVLEKKFVHTLNSGLIDSSKSVRAALWNAITTISVLITSE